MDLRIYLVVLISILATMTSSQRTTMRTCDCEYTVDGRCAYTLLLPAGGSDASTCPQTGGGSELTSEEVARLDAVQSNVESLSTNVSQLSSQTLQNAQLLSMLQSRVMTLYDRTANLTSHTGNTTQNDGMMTSDVQEQIDQQTESIAAIANSLALLQNDVTSVRNDVTSLTENVQMNAADVDAMRGNFTRMRSELEAAEEEVGRMQARIDALTSSGELCASRGLLVDTNPEAEIPADVITVSSQYNDDHGPEKVRIHYTGSGAGAWCPGKLIPSLINLNYLLSKAHSTLLPLGPCPSFCLAPSTI